MSTYVLLMKLTAKGIADIKSAPERIKAGIEAFEAVGGKVLSFYTLMGEYDYIAIGEAPSDDAAMVFLLGLGADGYVRTTSLKAFSAEQLAGFVSKLP